MTGDPLAEEHADGAPFTVLGHDRGRFYFLPHAAGQVASFRARQLFGPSARLLFAPPEWWRCTLGNSRSAGLRIGEWLIDAAYRAGIFDTGRVRGRGVWLDHGHVVIHCGDRLLVDAKVKPTWQLHSNYVYDAKEALNIELSDPLSVGDVAQLKVLLSSLPWRRPVDPVLLLGWLAVAPLSGLLAWRPHLWVAGRLSSWVSDDVVRPLLGRLAFQVPLRSTEANLRQLLHRDALPLVFEVPDPRYVHGARLKRLQRVMFAASCDTGAREDFRLRCCILVGSPRQPPVVDESLYSLLEIEPDNSAAERASFNEQVAPAIRSLLTADWRRRFRARTLVEARWINRNVEVLAKSLGRRGARLELANQIGTLLAGAYALLQGGPVSTAAPWNWLREFTVEETAGGLLRVIQQGPDSLRRLLESWVRIEIDGRAHGRTVRDLVDLVRTGSVDADVPMIDERLASVTLARYGMRWSGQVLFVSASHPGVGDLLGRAGWASELLRVPGATKVSRTIRFGSSVTRAVSVPWPRAGGGL